MHKNQSVYLFIDCTIQKAWCMCFGISVWHKLPNLRNSFLNKGPSSPCLHSLHGLCPGHRQIKRRHSPNTGNLIYPKHLEAGFWGSGQCGQALQLETLWNQNESEHIWSIHAKQRKSVQRKPIWGSHTEIRDERLCSFKDSEKVSLAPNFCWFSFSWLDVY